MAADREAAASLWQSRPGTAGRQGTSAPRTSYLAQALRRAFERLVALGETEAEDEGRGLVAAQKRGWRDRRDAVLLQQPHRDVGVAIRGDRRVVHHLVERPAARQRTEPGVLDQREKQIAFALIELADAAALRIVAQHLGVRHLNRAVDREGHPLVNALHLRAERLRCGGPANLPAGGVKRLRERT